MLNGKTISLKTIIWDVYKNTGIQDEINFADLIEWAVTCLEKIYHPDVFERKVIGHKNLPDLDVTNYRFKIPCDLVHLVALSVDGYRALPATHSFHQIGSGECCDINNFESDIATGQYIDNFGNVFSADLGLNIAAQPVTYQLNNNWITLSVKTGKVCIAYLAHPVDCDGFPMIPDNVSFKEAITRCLIMRLDYIKWRQNPSDSGLRALYEHSEQQYNFYVAQAINVAKLPDVDRMEGLKNQILRLKPSINEWYSNFKNLSMPEGRFIK